MESGKLRRKLFGGYDRAQVDEALRSRDQRLSDLEREAQLLAKRVVETEKAAREQIATVPASAGGAISRRLERMQERARRRAGSIRISAQDAVQLTERVAEISRLRDELALVMNELAALAGLRMRTGGEEPAAEGEAGAEGLYSGAVEVQVGPLRDFAQLTSFEDAAAEIDSASEVTVRSFSDGRATFSMSFAQPVELVRELEQRTPFEFNVWAAGDEAIVLDVARENRAA